MKYLAEEAKSRGEKILSMYPRGMNSRELIGHLHSLYGIDVSPDMIGTVTDAMLDEVTVWRQRPLDPVYPLVFSEALRAEIQEEGWCETGHSYRAGCPRRRPAVRARDRHLSRDSSNMVEPVRSAVRR